MNEQIKQIALRLLGLRDALELTTDEMASKIGVTTAEYTQYESGDSDIPMSFLYRVSQAFGVDTSVLVSGAEAHSNSFYLTRKGAGPSVERVAAYKYQDLASGFKQAKTTPFLVTVEPNDKPMHLNTHTGQEFNMVMEGTLQLKIGDTTMELNEGDSIYFDASKPHGMKALNGEKVSFLAMII